MVLKLVNMLTTLSFNTKLSSSSTTYLKIINSSHSPILIMPLVVHITCKNKIT